MRCSDVQLEWRIADVERKSNEAHNRLHEVDSLRGNVDSNEHTMRELSSEFDELRNRLQVQEDKLNQLMEAMTE